MVVIGELMNMVLTDRLLLGRNESNFDATSNTLHRNLTKD